MPALTTPPFEKMFLVASYNKNFYPIYRQQSIRDISWQYTPDLKLPNDIFHSSDFDCKFYNFRFLKKLRQLTSEIIRFTGRISF